MKQPKNKIVHTYYSSKETKEIMAELSTFSTPIHLSTNSNTHPKI